jgi:heme/copper-type cytochrome/quinol oxidase subunit 2
VTVVDGRIDARVATAVAAIAARVVRVGTVNNAHAASTCFRGAAIARPLVFVLALASFAAAQDRAPNRREITLVARDHQFIPNRIEVMQDDLVRITFTSERRPTSFAVDEYRILKRAGADKTIVFEFRADQPGTFTFYCSLTSDPGCRDMKGTLIVSPK